MPRIITVITLILIFIGPVRAEKMTKIKLPSPQTNTKKTLGQIINLRASYRDFSLKPLTQQQISYILWSANGLKIDTTTSASHTIPSAGATYPLEIYLVVGKNKLEDVVAGFYYYNLRDHSLDLIERGDKREELAQACLGQDFIAQAPVSIIICAIYKRTTGRYGERGRRYVDIEIGHSSQNIYLAATDLDLATVEVGAFLDAKLKQILKLDKDIEPLAVMPIGYKE